MAASEHSSTPCRVVRNYSDGTTDLQFSPDREAMLAPSPCRAHGIGFSELNCFDLPTRASPSPVSASTLSPPLSRTQDHAGRSSSAASTCDTWPLYRLSGGSPGLPEEAANARGGQPSKLERKIFVGGVPQEMDQEGLVELFNQHGHVQKAWLQKGQTPNEKTKHRGFGFVVFRQKECVDQLLGGLSSRFLPLPGGHTVEVKRAVRKEVYGEFQSPSRSDSSRPLIATPGGWPSEHQHDLEFPSPGSRPPSTCLGTLPPDPAASLHSASELQSRGWPSPAASGDALHMVPCFPMHSMPQMQVSSPFRQSASVPVLAPRPISPWMAGAAVSGAFPEFDGAATSVSPYWCPAPPSATLATAPPLPHMTPPPYGVGHNVLEEMLMRATPDFYED